VRRQFRLLGDQRRIDIDRFPAPLGEQGDGGAQQHPAVGAPVARVSDLSFGGEVGVGGTIHLGGRLSLSPGVRYALSNARFPRAGVMRMRYLVMDVGLIAEF